MRLRLESKTAKILTFAVVVVLLAPYGYVAWERYEAASFAQAGDRDSLNRAVQLQPGDAGYQERLARYLLFVDQDPHAALSHYRMAVAMDTYSARSWLGVAQSQLILGDTSAALNAIDHALEVDPQTPSVRWEAGNLLVTLGQSTRAMQEFRYTIANDPTMVGQGLQLIRRMGTPAEAARVALPPDPAIYARFINLLLQSKDMDGAKQVWSQMMALKVPFDPKQGFFYISAMELAGDLDEAGNAWASLAKMSPELARIQQANNAIHNGSFEYPILNGGLDWILPDTSQRPLLQNDVSDSHEGHRSLMVSFDGTRPSEIGLRQFLLLDPNSQYHFSGYIKGKLQSANGLRFVIADLNAGKRLLETDDVIESKTWAELTGDFHTGAEKHLYVLYIERSGTTLIRGTAWIDDIRLVKEPR